MTKAAFVEYDKKKYLKTGDIGFLYNNQLYISGRKKEMMIIRGKNYFPVDIEKTVQKSDIRFRQGCGAVFTYEIYGGRVAGQTFIENLNIFSHLANVGDAKSLVIHPASTTHHRMDNKALKKAGITESTIRLSVGLEDIEDLIADLDNALNKL